MQRLQGGQTSSAKSNGKQPPPPSKAITPMNEVASDLFEHNGSNWLFLVDRYSGYAWVRKLRCTSTTAITNILTTWFQDYGWPIAIRTDGGPQFRTEFATFCKNNEIRHELASAWHFNVLGEHGLYNFKGLSWSQPVQQLQQQQKQPTRNNLWRHLVC